MTRSQRLAVPFLFALFPCVLGAKGCYFGNDEVPLGSNARDGSAGVDGEGRGPSGAAGNEGGGEGGASGVPSHPGRDEPVFVFQSAPRVAAPSATGGTASP
ncbi:MAG TPA: hypothetical protein VG937_23805 [Polyangiaceae bacterium]|nr:hypothetical protein [Polyangiaceae bacterium]